jgi:hypothetical protein
MHEYASLLRADPYLGILKSAPRRANEYERMLLAREQGPAAHCASLPVIEDSKVNNSPVDAQPPRALRLTRTAQNTHTEILPFPIYSIASFAVGQTEFLCKRG